MWWILFVVICIYCAVRLFNNVHYWERKRVTHVKPWPLLGNFGESMIKRLTMVEQMQEVYFSHPEAQFIGLHHFNRPVLMIKDPDLIKQLLVKDFDSFINRTILFTEDLDPFFGRSLVALQGQRWRDMRATLSPAFTGSKMRMMYVLIKECAEGFTQYFLEEEKQKQETLTLEMKDVFTKYTNDVIASCAFGITCNSLKDPENEFYMTGKEITIVGLLANLKLFGFILMPNIMKFLGFTLFSKHTHDFFESIIKTTMDVREREGTIRPDMIHLLMEAKKGRLRYEAKETNDEDAGFATVQESSIGKADISDKPQLTDDDIIAQALLFFMAGYDTSSTLMCFLAHELALNPSVQQKLQHEIDTTFEKCNGNVDYESLLKMKYLDMVISECLRKWPPGFLTERLCLNSYLLEQRNESLVLGSDASVWFPVYCLHHDPKYYPDPEIFDPERFSDENKNRIVPFTYLPFGEGPRNCIGSRFALLETKALFAHLLRKFNIVVVAKTQIPLKLAKGQFNMAAEKGFWLGLKSR